TQTEVQGETRGKLPIVLGKPINGVVVVRHGAGARSAQRAIQAVRDEVVNERTQGLIIPLTARAGQIVRWGDILAALHAEFEGVLAANGRDSIRNLINVLNIALRREAVRAHVAAEFINFDVREIGERSRNREVRTIQA